MSVKCPKCHHENSEDSIYCGKCTTPLKLPEEIDVTETIETPKEELTTGVTFAGRYQIIEELGKGGMGKVYKVHDTEIREKVALKLLKSEISADEKTIERFRNEIKLARKIAHRNVCKMFDLGEEKGTRFITMEYVEGEDLKSMIRMMGLLSRGKAISIAKQVCEGLAEAHGFGIVHRDLKPSNIMIDKFGNAKIMDFGIARSLRAKGITGTGVMIGTPEYMSPEQVEGKETDQRTDIYSLGIILYEMVTGQTPFDGETAFSIALKHKSEIPRDPREFNAQIGDDLSILILQCLEKDRDKRYQRVEDLISDFTKIEESIPTTERVVPKRQPLTAREITVKFSLKKFIVPSVVVLALVILITVSVFLIKKLPSGKPLPLPPSHKQLTFTGNASYPAISPDGKFIAYVNRESYEEQNVMVQDLIGGQSIEIFSGLNCVNLKWSPDGSELVIHDREKGAVVLPRLGGTPLQLGGAANIAWSHDGSKLAKIFTAVKKIIIQNKTTGQTTSISLEGTFTFIKDVDWSPAGNLLLFLTIDDEERYAIWTITPDGKIQNKIHEDEAPLFSPRWSSEGNTIYYLRSKEQVKELWKIHITFDTGKPRGSPSLLLPGLQAGNYFNITTDGKKLLYTRELQYANLWLTIIKGEGKDLKAITNQLTKGTLLNVSPSISPDGNQIAFSLGDSEKANIYIIPIEGGTPRQLTFLNSYNINPVWSSNGKEIAFGSNQGGISKVWRLRVSGGSPFQFAKSQLSGNTFSLAWAPGNHILYQRPGNRNFHILNPATEEEIPLVEDDSVGWMFDPKYSSDGEKVAVMWNRRPSRGLWIIPLEDTSKAFFVKENVSTIGWSSDGNWGYVSEEKEGFIKILRIEVESRKEEELVNIEFKLEQGNPDSYAICMTPNGKKFVFPVYKIHSDVWIVENFDSDIKQK